MTDDIPRALEPSEAERLATLRAAMTHGGAGGVSRTVGQVLQRGMVRAVVNDLVGDGDDSLEARASKVDAFTVSDAATDTFTLTYVPVPGSWNVSLNGVTQISGVDCTISGRTLTITDPTDLFGGASVGDPDTLQVQYDYLASVPRSPVEEIVAYEATGWKYIQVAKTDSTDRSGVGFDDSAWSTGQAAFGIGTPGGGLPAPTTAWTLETRLWLRRTIPAGSSYSVRIRVDDESVVYWNGTQIGTSVIAGGVLEGDWIDVPPSAVTSGSQVLAVRATDTSVANKSYIDATVQGVLS